MNNQNKISEITEQIIELLHENMAYQKTRNFIAEQMDINDEKIRELKNQKLDLQQQMDAENMGHPSDVEATR